MICVRAIVGLSRDHLYFLSVSETINQFGDCGYYYGSLLSPVPVNVTTAGMKISFSGIIFVGFFKSHHGMISSNMSDLSQTTYTLATLSICCCSRSGDTSN